MRPYTEKTAFLLFVLTAFSWMTKADAQTFEYPEYPDNDTRIGVKYQGSSPTIKDFANAYLDFAQEEYEFFGQVNKEWKKHLQKKPLSKNCSILTDVKNGYMRYQKNDATQNDTTIMEMCFWNCADGKHKLVAANTIWRLDGDYGWDEHVGTRFYLYDNKKKEMRPIYAEDIGALYDGDGLSVFFLPRKGKNIQVSAAGGGERWDEILEWDGYQFTAKEK